MAALMRSRLSLTAVSGRPTVENWGRPVGEVHFHVDGKGIDTDNSAAQDLDDQVDLPVTNPIFIEVILSCEYYIMILNLQALSSGRVIG